MILKMLSNLFKKPDRKVTRFYVPEDRIDEFLDAWHELREAASLAVWSKQYSAIDLLTAREVRKIEKLTAEIFPETKWRDYRRGIDGTNPYIEIYDDGMTA